MKKTNTVAVLLLLALVGFGLWSGYTPKEESPYPSELPQEFPVTSELSMDFDAGPVAVSASEPCVPDALSMAVFMAQNGYTPIRTSELTTWASKYSSGGSPVDRLLWQAETMAPGLGLPAEVAGGLELVAQFRVLIPEAYRDSFRLRVVAFDSAGHRSPWSAWGSLGIDSPPDPSVGEVGQPALLGPD